MAQKNRLKFIILGLLTQQGQTGYDLAKSFDSDIGEFWQANHSQIYPLLKKMEKEGLITHEILTVGQKMEKKLYLITKAGETLFDQWLKEPSLPDNSHDEFILKLYFINDAHSSLLPVMLREQAKIHHAKLGHLEQQLKRKFPDQTAIDRQYGHFLVLRHALNRENQYANWLDGLLDGDDNMV